MPSKQEASRHFGVLISTTVSCPPPPPVSFGLDWVEHLSGVELVSDGWAVTSCIVTSS